MNAKERDAVKARAFVSSTFVMWKSVGVVHLLCDGASASMPKGKTVILSAWL